MNTLTLLVSLIALINTTYAHQLSNRPISRHFNSDPDARVTLAGIELAGNGCHHHNTSAIISPDGQELSVIFDNMLLEHANSQKTCQLSLNLIVPHGYQVALVQVEYRGYIFLPKNTSAKITTTTQLFYPKHNRSMPTLSGQHLFKANTDEDYLLAQDTTIRGTPQFTTCSQPVSIRTKTEMSTIGNSGHAPLFTIDSSDFAISNPSEGLQYQLVWKKCAYSNSSNREMVPERHQNNPNNTRGANYGRSYRP